MTDRLITTVHSEHEHTPDLTSSLTSSMAMMAIVKNLKYEEDEVGFYHHSYWTSHQTMAILYHASMCTKKQKFFTPKWKTFTHVTNFEQLNEKDIIGEARRCMKKINSHFLIGEQSIVKCELCMSKFMPIHSEIRKAMEWIEVVDQWVTLYVSAEKPLISNYTAAFVMSMSIEIIHNGCLQLSDKIQTKTKYYINKGLYCPGRNGLASILLVVHGEIRKEEQISEMTLRLDLTNNTVMSVRNKMTNLENKNKELANIRIKEISEYNQLKIEKQSFKNQIDTLKDHSARIVKDTNIHLQAMRTTLESNGLTIPMVRSNPDGQTKSKNKTEPLILKCCICLESHNDMTIIALQPCRHIICDNHKSIKLCPLCTAEISDYQVIYI